MTDEIWRSIPGFEGHYEVSDLGKVRSLDRTIRKVTGISYRYKGKELRPTPDRWGYPYVVLAKAGQRNRRYAVHLLVLRAFVGEADGGQVARHLNGVSSDPRLVNLRYGTLSENMLDSVDHGTHWHSSKTHCVKGHEYSGRNVAHRRTKKGTQRVCRACENQRSRDYMQRKTAREAASSD